MIDGKINQNEKESLNKYVAPLTPARESETTLDLPRGARRSPVRVTRDYPTATSATRSKACLRR